MKKICVLFITLLSSLNMVLADEPVQLVAPRMQNPAESAPALQSTQASKPKPKASTSKPKTKIKAKHKNHVKKAKVQVKTDYDKISRLIENGYYESADNMLLSAMGKNPKDIKAQSLWCISLAKQAKLDPAQKVLNELIKKYPNNSDIHYAQGVVYYQRTTSSNMVYREKTSDLYKNALTEFKKSISIDKTNAKAFNAAGVLSLKLNNTAEARNYFKKAIELDKNYSIAIDNLGTMDLAEGKTAEAQKKFEQALKLNSQNSIAMYHLAQVAIKKGDFNHALYHLNNALSLNPTSPAIYNLMGKAYFAQGNDAAAIEALKKSIAIKPEFTISYLDLADVYSQRKDGELAIEQLKTALSISPDYYNAKLKLADISLETGKCQQAIDVYSQLVGVQGFDSAALKGLGNAYYALAQSSSSKAVLGSNKELYKALDYINKAVRANNQDLELHLAKIKLERITNKEDYNLDDLNKIINSKDDSLMGNVLKAEAYIKRGDYANAQKSFNIAAGLSNGLDEDLALSEVLIFQNQYETAQKLLQKALKKSPQDAQIINNFDYIKRNKKYADNCFSSAMSFIKARNNSMAIEYLSRSISINPYNAQAQLFLAELYEKQNDFQNASKCYKAYLGLEPNASNTKRIQAKIRKLDNKL